MRISDWSSDVCSSDLTGPPIGERQIPLGFANSKKFAVPYSEGLDSRAVSALSGTEDDALCVRVSNNRQKRRPGENFFNQVTIKRSEERRVGKECVMTCRSRGAREH